MGYAFDWPPCSESPFFIKPDGARIIIDVRGNIPYLACERDGNACPAVSTDGLDADDEDADVDDLLRVPVARRIVWESFQRAHPRADRENVKSPDENVAHDNEDNDESVVHDNEENNESHVGSRVVHDNEDNDENVVHDNEEHHVNVVQDNRCDEVGEPRMTMKEMFPHMDDLGATPSAAQVPRISARDRDPYLDIDDSNATPDGNDRRSSTDDRFRG
jgi:hypothetical protein